MQLFDVKRLVESTADAAFAVDGAGLIVAWNAAAEVLLGKKASETIDRPCRDIIHGMDECGSVCSENCTVRQAVQNRNQVGNFDLQIETPNGTQWCNVSVLVTDVANSTHPYAIHIVREVDTRKRLEMLMRDFVVAETKLPVDEVKNVRSAARSPIKEADLTRREIEILRLLAKGHTTEAIADELHISRTTVNNHVQSILRKLNAHNRL